MYNLLTRFPMAQQWILGILMARADIMQGANGGKMCTEILVASILGIV